MDEEKKNNFFESVKSEPSFLIMCLITLVYTLSAGALWFILPIIAQRFVTGIETIGLVLSIPYAFAFLLSIPCGALSDRIGRKTVGIIGLVIVFVLGYFIKNIDSIDIFYLVIILLGLSISLISSPARAYIMDLTPRGLSAEYFGIFISAMYLGLALGPIFTGFYMDSSIEIGTEFVSRITMGTGIIGILLFTFIRETVNKPQPLLYGLRNLLLEDRIVTKAFSQFSELKKLGGVILLLTVLFAITDGFIWALEPLYYTSLKLNSSTGSIIFSMFYLPLIIFSLPAGYIADKYGVINGLKIGLIISGTALIIFGFSNSVAVLIVCSFITSIGFAFSWASLSGWITSISREGSRGNITGVWNMAIEFGYMSGPIIGGLIAGCAGIGHSFSIQGGLLLISVILIEYLRRGYLRENELNHC